MDRLTSEKRSWLMSRVPSKNTTPEIAVRSLLHKLGYRYRLHSRDIPGKPDIVFRKRKKVIFIHGCFWHGHANCKYAKIPKSRVDFWTQKMERNRLRDAQIIDALKSAGWSALTVWQCELKDLEKVAAELAAFLGKPRI